MKVLINIPYNETIFRIKILKSHSFIKNAKPMSGAFVDLWEDLKETTQQIFLNKKGELKTTQEMLNDYDKSIIKTLMDALVTNRQIIQLAH